LKLSGGKSTGAAIARIGASEQGRRSSLLSLYYGHAYAELSGTSAGRYVMSRTGRLGIVGGYGATGSVVVSELWSSCPRELRIGGRDLARGKALAAKFDGRVSAAQLDVLSPASLDHFCSECSIIVHCGGPVMRLQDRVAQAALRRGCHYVDLAGLTLVKDRLLPHARKISDLGLSFVISAGWLPGLTELVPAHALARARASMGTIESLTIHFGDSGDWSTSAYQDIAWYVRRFGLRRPGYFRKGERVAVKMTQGSSWVDLGGRIGRRWFAMQSLSEQDEIGRQFQDGDVFIFAYLPGIRAALAAAVVALLRLPNGLSVRLLRDTLGRSSLSVGGFVVATVLGSSQGRRIALTAELTYDKHHDYQINGLVIATVARLLSEGRGVRPGVHFLADAVDPIAFMAELQKGGLEVSERIEPLPVAMPPSPE
jgi:hypothetical protein